MLSEAKVGVGAFFQQAPNADYPHPALFASAFALRAAADKSLTRATLPARGRD
jgi:hypothetical protein